MQSSVFYSYHCKNRGFKNKYPLFKFEDKIVIVWGNIRWHCWLFPSELSSYRQIISGIISPLFNYLKKSNKKCCKFPLEITSLLGDDPFLSYIFMAAATLPSYYWRPLFTIGIDLWLSKGQSAKVVPSFTSSTLRNCFGNWTVPRTATLSDLLLIQYVGYTHRTWSQARWASCPPPDVCRRWGQSVSTALQTVVMLFCSLNTQSISS